MTRLDEGGGGGGGGVEDWGVRKSNEREILLATSGRGRKEGEQRAANEMESVNDTKRSIREEVHVESRKGGDQWRDEEHRT